MKGSVDDQQCYLRKTARRGRRNLSTACIDYKKAFDSVPYSWMLKCLQMYKINPVLITFIEESISQWKTNLTLVHKEGVLETGTIRIKRGIFQGDSLSPLLFTISLNPLSQELQKTAYGYQLDEQTRINHLFYVDDQKLYGAVSLRHILNVHIQLMYTQLLCSNDFSL